MDRVMLCSYRARFIYDSDVTCYLVAFREPHHGSVTGQTAFTEVWTPAKILLYLQHLLAELGHYREVKLKMSSGSIRRAQLLACKIIYMYIY
jgi:hypothetical protein